MLLSRLAVRAIEGMKDGNHKPTALDGEPRHQATRVRHDDLNGAPIAGRDQVGEEPKLDPSRANRGRWTQHDPVSARATGAAYWQRDS